MSDYGNPRSVLVDTWEGSLGQIRLGKIARLAGSTRYVYVNNISAQYRAEGSYAVAPCVIKLCQAWGVRWIHYYDRDANTTYTTRIDALLANGVSRKVSYRPTYFYLRTLLWGKQTGQRRYEWVQEGNVLELDWLELEPVEEVVTVASAQLSLL